MQQVPDPKTTLFLSKVWIAVGAIFILFFYAYFSRYEWYNNLGELLKGIVNYFPILILNGLAHLFVLVKHTDDYSNHAKVHMEIYISSLFGALLGALLSPLTLIF